MTSSTCTIWYPDISVRGWVFLRLLLLRSGSNIPETNIALHEATCRRHKYKCSVCAAVVGLEDKEEHDASHVLEVRLICTLFVGLIVSDRNVRCAAVRFRNP